MECVECNENLEKVEICHYLTENVSGKQNYLQFSMSLGSMDCQLWIRFWVQHIKCDSKT